MKRRVLHPIVIEGRAISNTWWGRAWCDNIDNYADYENRLPRGKTYARQGRIRDLVIEKGLVTATVQGSRAAPYRVRVAIKPLSEERIKLIEDKCSQKFESMDQFISGDFPEDFKDFFTASGSGLFPRFGEIGFDCSCPDWARLCKHVASVLYGIGRRLDDDPLLLLKLRGIDVESFTRKIVSQEATQFLARSMLPLREGREMGLSEACGLFGIDSFDEEELKAELEAKSEAGKTAGKPAAKPAAGKTAAGKTSAASKPGRPRARKPAKPKA